MKTISLILTIIISSSAVCQEVVVLNLSRAYTNQDLSMTLRIPTDEGKDFFQLNMDESKFESIKDNQGFDLMEATNGDINRSNSYTFNNPGYVDYYINLKSVPSKGSTEIHVKGVMVLEYNGDTPQAEDITIKMSDRFSGKGNTRLGEVRLENSGEISMGDKVYMVYRVIGDMPITSFTLEIPDDSEKTGIGVSQDEIMYLDPPSELKMKVEFSSVERVNVPVDLKFGVGL